MFNNQEHVGPLGLEVAPEFLSFVPTTRTEGACASSSIALYNAIFGIESGRFRRVLVIGVEKMSLLATPDVTHALAYKQLIGEPIGMAPSSKTPEIAVVFNVGGSAATNCVTTPKRIYPGA